MTDKRVTAPAIVPGEKLKGPASYFPSIEKTYGQPMQHWIDLVATELATNKKHSEVVAVLKGEHSMGHGHANAVVAFVRAELAK